MRKTGWITKEFKKMVEYISDQKADILDRLYDPVLLAVADFLKQDQSKLEWHDIELHEGLETKLVYLLATLNSPISEFEPEQVMSQLSREHPEMSDTQLEEYYKGMETGKKLFKVILPIALCEKGNKEQIIEFLEKTKEAHRAKQTSLEELTEQEFDLDELSEEQIMQLELLQTTSKH